ncbi:MAG: hypothetical protein FJ128_11940, partial [Deltaproteobacteria bacterium]|nr:hypothetical protein [Deltaproteobacteria bacterium]
MFRIRLHGRGGQGIKTAGRMLGTAFFRAGFEVQDAPRYGAERRGAPIFAYVRADRRPIQERGVIRRPDLVIVADDTLMTVSGAEVLAGVAAHTVLLLASQVPPDLWRERLRTPGPVLTLPTAPAADPLPHRFLGAACAGAAAGLVGLIPREALARAVEEELAAFSAAVVGQNREQALQAFDGMSRHSGCVTEGPEAGAEAYAQPNWLDLPPESVEFSAPAIFTPATSRLVPTGLWRTVRPVLDRAR